MSFDKSHDICLIAKKKETEAIFRPHDVELEQMRLMAQLSPTKRIEVWLDGREVSY